MTTPSTAHAKGPGPLQTDMKTFFLMMFARAHSNAIDCRERARHAARRRDASEAAMEIKAARGWAKDCRNFLSQATLCA